MLCIVVLVEKKRYKEIVYSDAVAKQYSWATDLKSIIRCLEMNGVQPMTLDIITDLFWFDLNNLAELARTSSST
jgi:hypothetical protein